MGRNATLTGGAVRSRRRLPALVAAVALTTVWTGLAWGGAAAATASRGDVVTDSDCAREAQLVRSALDKSTRRVDVDGDGRLDRVAVVTDWKAVKRCRAFVAVHVRGGATYSAALQRPTVTPKGLRARIVGLPDLGTNPGAEIVVDTRTKADSMVAQLFTLTDHGLRFVPMPAFEDGTFVVEGGGVTLPRGAGCTRTGALRLSMATLEGEDYEVTRHVYRLRGERLRIRSVAVKVATVPGDELGARFPEFVTPHFRACTGRVVR